MSRPEIPVASTKIKISGRTIQVTKNWRLKMLNKREKEVRRTQAANNVKDDQKPLRRKENFYQEVKE
jgi:hypothetical protein